MFELANFIDIDLVRVVNKSENVYRQEKTKYFNISNQKVNKIYSMHLKLDYKNVFLIRKIWHLLSVAGPYSKYSNLAWCTIGQDLNIHDSQKDFVGIFSQ